VSQGVHTLVLMHEPAADAEDGSGFVSRYADDALSANVYRAADRAGLDHDTTLHWHVVPWWVSNPSKGPRRLLGEAVRAEPYLGELLDLADAVPREVVLLGAPTQKAWDHMVRRAGVPWRLSQATVTRAPHPNPLVHDRIDPYTGRRNGDLLVEAFRAAARRARGEEVVVGARRKRPF
jgi:hypothetical protein